MSTNLDGRTPPIYFSGETYACLARIAHVIGRDPSSTAEKLFLDYLCSMGWENGSRTRCMADIVEMCPFTSRKRAEAAAERLEAFAVDEQLQDERAPMVAADVVGHRPRLWAVEADYLQKGGAWRPCGPQRREK